MVSYGLGDGDTISSPISLKKQPPLHVASNGEVLLCESLYGVMGSWKYLSPY